MLTILIWADAAGRSSEVTTVPAMVPRSCASGCVGASRSRLVATPTGSANAEGRRVELGAGARCSLRIEPPQRRVGTNVHFPDTYTPVGLHATTFLQHWRPPRATWAALAISTRRQGRSCLHQDRTLRAISKGILGGLERTEDVDGNYIVRGNGAKRVEIEHGMPVKHEPYPRDAAGCWRRSERERSTAEGIELITRHQKPNRVPGSDRACSPDAVGVVHPATW